MTQNSLTTVEMKDSGIPWIGGIPAHWSLNRVKEVAVWQTGFTPPTQNIEFYDGNDEWLTIADLKSKRVDASKMKIDGRAFPDKRKVPSNSLLFSFKLSMGQVAFNEMPVFTNEAICSFLPKSKVDLSFFYYCAPVFVTKNAKTNIYGADLLNQELIANAILVLPSESEQKDIANFLDKETSKIDQKVATLAKRVKLLEEYKQALVFETVTKGLDKSAPMKDSGVPWIGEIPAHWNVARMKECVSKMISGGTPKSNDANLYQDDGIPWVVIGDLTGRGLIEETKNKVSAKGVSENNLKIIPKGTLLYSMYASVGFSAFLGVSATINQAILALFFKPSVIKQFVKHSLDAYRDNILKEAVGTTQNNLNAEKVRRINMLRPPVGEQVAIATYLDKETLKIDSQLELVKKKIVLLEEYKHALIFEAVTGKMEIPDA